MEVRERPRGPPECPAGIPRGPRGPSEGPIGAGRLSRKLGSSREALAEVREWSGGPPGGLGGVERPLKNPGGVVRASQRSGKGGPG